VEKTDKMTTDPKTDDMPVADPQSQQPAGLSDDELKAQEGEELPDREQMSLINANVAAPVNAAVALNALSDNSAAIANAEQSNDITQTN
jgi:hypothetical protein